MVVSLNGFAAGFFFIKSLILSESYSTSEVKMRVIASINPLQPQQPERLHRRGASTHWKSEVLEHGTPDFSFESIIKPMFVCQAAGHVPAPSRAWLWPSPCPFSSHWVLTAPPAPATLAAPCQALAAVQGRNGLWFHAAEQQACRHLAGYSTRLTLGYEGFGFCLCPRPAVKCRCLTHGSLRPVVQLILSPTYPLIHSKCWLLG